MRCLFALHSRVSLLNTYSFITLSIVLLSFMLAGCSSPDAADIEVIPKEFRISPVDQSVTEVFIAVNASVFTGGETITIKRDEKPVLSFISTGKDTVVMDSMLTENTTYSYSASAYMKGKPAGESNSIKMTTLLPTSHNFTWKMYEFGDFGTNILYDVKIIDENNIWAVGEMTFDDPSGKIGQIVKNMVQWDGNDCKLSLVYTKDYAGPGSVCDSSIGALRSIVSFSKSNIWVADVANLIRWDGYKYINKVLFNYGVDPPYTTKVGIINGTSENDIYLGGENGTLFHYTGSGRWKKLQTNTNGYINDIWPYKDVFTGENKYLCAVSNVLDESDRKILEVDSRENVSERKWFSDLRVSSVWTNKGYPVFACGDGVFENKHGYWTNIGKNFPNYLADYVRGNGLNDIFVGGDFGMLEHYNGKDWMIYPEFLYPVISVITGIDIKGNTVAISALGRYGNRAMLIIGKRN